MQESKKKNPDWVNGYKKASFIVKPDIYMHRHRREGAGDTDWRETGAGMR